MYIILKSEERLCYYSLNVFILFTDGKCEDISDCETIKPDCTFPAPKENCQKYCGLCEGNY